MRSRAIYILLLAAALGGCAAGTQTQAPAQTAETETETGPGAWQSGLDADRLSKVTHDVWLWLDDAEGEDANVRVRARLRHGLYPDEVDRYAELGLEADEGDKAPAGSVTREQLIELVREHDVLLVEAASAKAAEDAEAPADADSAKAEAGEDEAGDDEDTATASAASASDDA